MRIVTEKFIMDASFVSTVLDASICPTDQQCLFVFFLEEQQWRFLLTPPK